MKICVPVELNEGLESKPFGHFGSAPMFLVYDLENKELSKIDNGDLEHEHGKCQPIKALLGNVVDAVIVGGIGQGAIVKLNSMGIKVYKANADTVGENINLFKENKLNEFPSNHTCSHDGCGHH
ncbi:MAG: NifB/NifX family molybdenum-iron cluster-binding protein [Paraclostridium sp.]|uniref:NifB/NifX family molybdenum-iron cluster-binding protein n=1 Tax=Paraclostridium sp. TaxID=2023273 RepID=UPI003F41863A